MDPKTLPQMPDLWRLSIDLIERTVTAEVCGRTSVRAFDSADEARLFYEGMSNGLSYGAAWYAAGMDRAAEEATKALDELVALKRLKDDIERWVRDEATGQQWPQMQPYARRMEAVEEYKRRKPAAWAAAFAIVDAIRAAKGE